MKSYLLNTYLLTDIVSFDANPVHKELIGRICTIDSIEPYQFGWFKAMFDDGPHRICTSIVKRVDTTGPDGDILLHTENSVYTFSFVKSDSAEEAREELYARKSE